MKSYKHLFSHALAAAPDRLHFAAHSHHLWPDATRAAQIEAWDDAARLADLKWDKVFGEVLPRAQRGVAAELRLPSPETIAFAPNTHELLARLVSAHPRRPLRILSTDGEFHSFRRQSRRWVEAGLAELDLIPVEPFETFDARFVEAARAGGHDFIFLSQVFFNSGHVFTGIGELASLARPDGPWVAIDGYHGFMAIPNDLAAVADRIFYLSGSYKYAMAGEAAAFMHAPPGFGPRPENTGWFAEFAKMTGPQGAIGYGEDASRFMGATFDSTGIYRLGAVFDMLARERLDTSAISARCNDLKAAMARLIADGRAGPLQEAELIVRGEGLSQARFLALRHPRAQDWQAALKAANAITDVRADVLRIGFGLYQDLEDLERFADRAAQSLRRPSA